MLIWWKEWKKWNSKIATDWKKSRKQLRWAMPSTESVARASRLPHLWCLLLVVLNECFLSFKNKNELKRAIKQSNGKPLPVGAQTELWKNIRLHDAVPIDPQLYTVRLERCKILNAWKSLFCGSFKFISNFGVCFIANENAGPETVPQWRHIRTFQECERIDARACEWLSNFIHAPSHLTHYTLLLQLPLVDMARDLQLRLRIPLSVKEIVEENTLRNIQVVWQCPSFRLCCHAEGSWCRYFHDIFMLLVTTGQHWHSISQPRLLQTCQTKLWTSLVDGQWKKNSTQRSQTQVLLSFSLSFLVVIVHWGPVCY